MTARLLLCLGMLATTAPGVLAQRQAAPPAAAVPAAPAASGADTLVIQSSVLGRARQVFVSLPASHARTTRQYPVIVVLDGEANFRPAVTVATELARLGHVPEAIIVGIPNATSNFQDRVHDMTPPGLSVSGSSRNEGGDRFLDFIERELLPVIGERYRGGAPNVFVGHSSGGVIATWAAATRATFPVVISIDAPMHLDEHWLVDRLLERARSGGPKLVRYVSMETRFGWSDEHWRQLVREAPGWMLHREELAGESHESMVFLSLYQGLKNAFRDYSIVGAPQPPRASAVAAFDHYRQIEAEFDAELPPPVRVLNRLVEDLLTEGRVEPARSALAWLAEGYGAHDAVASSQAMIDRVAALPPLAETVESLQATPLPTAAEMAPFLGEWKGEAWMNEDTRWPRHVRFRVQDGTVIGESFERLLDGSMGWRAYQYMKVIPGGLEFGRMNGMRPMGMIILTGRRSADVLEGEEAFRGIVLPLPTGHTPPPVYFRIVKQ